jgi:hypothetical protein
LRVPTPLLAEPAATRGQLHHQSEILADSISQWQCCSLKLTAMGGVVNNIIVTLGDESASWLRVEAAKADLSMLAIVAEMLAARMG